MKLLSCVLALVLASTAHAGRFVNITIDDASPSVIYAQTPYVRCTPTSSCDPSWVAQLYNGTSSITSGAVIVPFQGTAVYVYLGVEGTSYFSIDGSIRSSATGQDYMQNGLAFGEWGLANTNHVLAILPSNFTGEIIQLDYIVYTHELPGKNVGAIVGWVVGGLAFMAVLSWLGLLLVRRRRLRRISMRGIRLRDDWTERPSLQLDSGSLPQKPKIAL
ncbi:hypothetical protein HMN09_00556800 [Mycena chlorophos]|uniref:Uncharacterized protein n=1 Tax=Mycena chlorophos TaxID=658473 RepID=A0A8H6WGH2_MYCCL|nr:hypothetical protein HMN09_00556800 [Mycena chlorophos]